MREPHCWDGRLKRHGGRRTLEALNALGARRSTAVLPSRVACARAFVLGMRPHARVHALGLACVLGWAGRPVRVVRMAAYLGLKRISGFLRVCCPSLSSSRITATKVAVVEKRKIAIIAMARAICGNLPPALPRKASRVRAHRVKKRQGHTGR